MKKLKLVYENHWNFGIHLSDTALLVQGYFSLLGFQVDIEKELCAEAVNIVIENFEGEFTDKVLSFQSMGGKLIIIATEFLTGDTFNYFKDGKDRHYDKVEYWKKRYLNFCKVVEGSIMIFHLSSSQVETYKKLFGCGKVFYMPHVYYPGARRFLMRSCRDRDIDIVFTGSMTEYRHKILTKFCNYGLNVRCLPMLTADFHRFDIVSRSKLAVSIPQNEVWSYPSNSRLYFHLVHGSAIVNHKTQYSCDLEKYLCAFDQEYFVEETIACLEDESYWIGFEKSVSAFCLDSEIEESDSASITALLMESNK